jgi:hypothetical protein
LGFTPKNTGYDILIQVPVALKADFYDDVSAANWSGLCGIQLGM